MSILSCSRDFPEEVPEYPEGESTLSATVEFSPMTGALEQTRSAGRLIRTISDLNLVLYQQQADGNFEFRKTIYLPASQLTLSDENRTGSSFAESTTPRAHFQLTLPHGTYKIYTIANMGANFSATYQTAMATEAGLKNIVLDWNAVHPEKNNQMFGWFSATDGAIPADGSFDAPALQIGPGNTQIYSWIRRAASKVTIAFDGSALNENVYLYIRSVQIKDIPKTCLLGADNSPSDLSMLIHEGETITYSDSKVYDMNYPVRITRGTPFYPVKAEERHSETAPALYFFENRQGTGESKLQDADQDHLLDHPGLPGAPTYRPKDNKPCGSYIEVRAFYNNSSLEQPSSGEIIYRFMLGKNITDNYDAVRNYHYKVTMKFKKNAADVDWHIEYHHPVPPSIIVANPLYISYLNEQSLSVPVKLEGNNWDSNVRVEIIDNPWCSPYSANLYKTTNPEDYNGFLLLDLPAHELSDATQRQQEYNRNKVRNYTIPAGSNTCHIDLWTRGLTLGNSFSGNNIDYTTRRSAKVRISATINGKPIHKDVDVIQVERCDNPVGIWRAGNSTKKFTAELKYLTRVNGKKQYIPIYSEGPWRARVLTGKDWVRIGPQGSGQLGTSDVTGTTGSTVTFDYAPGSTTTGYRSAIIEVRYHNNTCVHYIAVSQGNGELNVNGIRWCTSNFDGKGETANPLLEGCMFVWGNLTDGILPINNTYPKRAFGVNCDGAYFEFSSGKYTTLDLIRPNQAGFVNSKVATYEQYLNLDAASSNLYGILYGQECDHTLEDYQEATSYLKPGDQKGMAGIFAVIKKGNPQAAQSLFFPISCTGYGHRKYNEKVYDKTNPAKWVLRYAQRDALMPKATAEIVPNYYDLYERRGAIYWCKSLSQENTAYDLNYYTYLVQGFAMNAHPGTDNPQKYTDACLVRRVRN